MQAPTDQRTDVSSSDQQLLKLRATVGSREEFSFRTGSGVHSSDRFRPAERCLLDVIYDVDPDDLLVVDANYGVLGVVPAGFGTNVVMTETSARATDRCRENARRNAVSDRVTVALTSSPAVVSDPVAVACIAPRPYAATDIISQRIADTLAILEPGGRLLIAGDPHSGIRRYKSRLETLCPDVTQVFERDGYRVFEAIRPPSFDPPELVSSQLLRPTVNSVSLTLVTRPGLFSASRLDSGTRALAEQLSLQNDDSVLDLCCGYGPLGVYAAQLTAEHVVMSDDDCVATTCARESAACSGVNDRVEVVTADGIRGVADHTFDRVLCNPPTHAGAPILHELMHGAREVLATDGTLHLVHHAGIDFDRYLAPYFDKVVADHAGEYRVACATR